MTASNVIPIASWSAAIAPSRPHPWTSGSGNVSASLTIAARACATETDRAELVGYLRQLADLFEGRAGVVFFGEGG